MVTALAKAVVESGITRVPDPLPDSARVVDSGLVARVQGQIRETIRTTIARGLEEIGKILLREFYGDSVDAYRSTSPRKHASLQVLLKSCESIDFPVKKTVLANALQLAAFSREVPSGSPFLALPPSHRIELLRLKLPNRIHELAAAALEKKMSMRRVRDEVRRLRRRHKSPRGRKPLPVIVRATSQAIRALQRDQNGQLRFDKEDVLSLSAGQRTLLLSLTVTLQRHVGELFKIQ